MQLHPKQRQIIGSKARFKVVRAGRRGGKTFMSIEDMLYIAMSGDDRNVFYIAPTQIQARKIIWEDLKARLNGVGKVNESRLEVEVPTQDGGNSRIYIAGWENRENFRGMSADHIVFDELDTMVGFIAGWQDIFRPALSDKKGSATFIGTPKKENPNLRRLEKVAEVEGDYAFFHYQTKDNPHIDPDEIEAARKQVDSESFRQEYLAEYVTSGTTLFNYDALVDMKSNTVTKDGNKYLIVDVAGGGKDKTKFGFFDGMELTRIETFSGINTETIIQKIKEYAANERIPFSHIAVDAIGEGAGVASSSLLEGVISYKGSHSPFYTDKSLTSENKFTTHYRNLRSQCIFALADVVNKRQIASRVGEQEMGLIIEELFTYQDVSKGDGKRQATGKEQIKEMIGRSPDSSDLLQMRMYFEIRKTATGQDTVEDSRRLETQQVNFANKRKRAIINNTR